MPDQSYGPGFLLVLEPAYDAVQVTVTRNYGATAKDKASSLISNLGLAIFLAVVVVFLAMIAVGFGDPFGRLGAPTVVSVTVMLASASFLPLPSYLAAAKSMSHAKRLPAANSVAPVPVSIQSSRVQGVCCNVAPRASAFASMPSSIAAGGPAGSCARR